MKLYNYFRSGAAYRVRIALNLKQLEWTHVGVHLLRGEQRGDAFLAVNPAGLVPALVTDGGEIITQSLAIMEWLDEAYPERHRLLPGDALQRARIRALALSLVADAHPLNNVRVLNYLTGTLALTEVQKSAWIEHWMKTGLANFAAMLDQFGHQGPYCCGEQPTLADCVLIPQLFSARRFGVAVETWPRLLAIDAACAELPAFQAAHPSRQPDCPPE